MGKHARITLASLSHVRLRRKVLVLNLSIGISVQWLLVCGKTEVPENMWTLPRKDLHDSRGIPKWWAIHSLMEAKQRRWSTSSNLPLPDAEGEAEVLEPPAQRSRTESEVEKPALEPSHPPTPLDAGTPERPVTPGTPLSAAEE